jgi:hypothetical protein
MDAKDGVDVNQFNRDDPNNLAAHSRVSLATFCRITHAFGDNRTN